MKKTTMPKCKYCWDKGYSTQMVNNGAETLKHPCLRCPKCQWCGSRYGEHEDSRPEGSAVPKTPCLLLKVNFLVKTTIPENARVTCLNIDCPERKSVCCGAISMPVSGGEGTAYFICSMCRLEYVGGKCNALNFASDTDVTTKPDVEDVEAQIYTELAYMMGVLEASGMPSHQVRRHVEQQGKLLEAVIGQALKEIVVCAAIKAKNGEVIRGHRHADAIHTALRMRHELKDLSFADQGFVTSRNRYVSREEGRVLQDAAGIPSASPEGYMPGTLFSEDLY